MRREKLSILRNFFLKYQLYLIHQQQIGLCSHHWHYLEHLSSVISDKHDVFHVLSPLSPLAQRRTREGVAIYNH